MEQGHQVTLILVWRWVSWDEGASVMGQKGSAGTPAAGPFHSQLEVIHLWGHPFAALLNNHSPSGLL